jgi:hypothetical protein
MNNTTQTTAKIMPFIPAFKRRHPTPSLKKVTPTSSQQKRSPLLKYIGEHSGSGKTFDELRREFDALTQSKATSVSKRETSIEGGAVATRSKRKRMSAAATKTKTHAKKKRSNNAWQSFIQQHTGQGYSLKELSRLYNA